MSYWETDDANDKYTNIHNDFTSELKKKIEIRIIVVNYRNFDYSSENSMFLCLFVYLQ